MTLSGMPGYQKLVTVNGYQLTLKEPMNIYPQQELKIRDFIQGGPRTQIYEMGGKIVKGNMSLPLTIDGNGDVDSAVKQLLECAQYPLQELTINTNYVLSKQYITADLVDARTNLDNCGFNIYERMSFDNCGITRMTISVPEQGDATLDIELIGLVNKSVHPPSQTLPTYDMMRRSISYADCDVYLTDPGYHWDTTRSFNLTLENKIEPIFTFLKETDPPENWTDLPIVLGMGESHLQGEIKYSVDRGTAASEQLTLPSGAWIGSDLIFDLSGIKMTLPRCIAELTQQPIELGLLQRTTKFIGLFRTTYLDEEEGHFITFK